MSVVNLSAVLPQAPHPPHAPQSADERAAGSSEEQIERLRSLLRIGTALSAERDRDRLLESILLEAKGLCRADGGTLYLRTEDDHLEFVIMRTDSLGISLGGTTGRRIELPRIPLHDPHTGAPNHNNVATYAALARRAVHIRDAYDESDAFDFSGTERFDRLNGYRSTSFFTVPMIDSRERVIGVLQLLNARDSSGAVVPFLANDQEIVEALASQGAVALENAQLLEQQKRLLESFIKMIASAIDAKSPYTGGHCERVPILVEMIAKAACAEHQGPFASFDLSATEWYELRIASWLHDCGKVVTPVHVMDKATKLETIYDRIDAVRARFEVLRRDRQIQRLEAQLAGLSGELASTDVAESMPAGKEPAPMSDSSEPQLLAATPQAPPSLEQLDEDLRFLERANIGGEFLSDPDKDRIRQIAAYPYQEGGVARPLLTANEVDNLTIARGTLTTEERLVINGHMVQTLQMLNELPFPESLARVPEFAAGHHETMDGKGYPRGLYAGDMSVPARMMAVADVFEALTAQDRPYKSAKTLSETMRIMGDMKRRNHLDPEVFDLFVRSGVYREYAARYLSPALIDAVDEAALVDIVPLPFAMPDAQAREDRWVKLLPEYGGQDARSPHGRLSRRAAH